METLKRRTSWNYVDRFLSHWRMSFIMPYLNKESVICDVGCGQEGKNLVSISNKIKEGYGYDFNLKTDVNPKANIFLSNKDFLLCEKNLMLLFYLQYLSICLILNLWRICLRVFLIN